jgi:hypothetical protein
MQRALCWLHKARGVQNSVGEKPVLVVCSTAELDGGGDTLPYPTILCLLQRRPSPLSMLAVAALVASQKGGGAAATMSLANPMTWGETHPPIPPRPPHPPHPHQQ